MPFFSAALIFSSHPIFAQNLVDTIPDFYFLEDARDGFFPVRACSTSTTTENDFVKTLGCPIVATISVSDLKNFLADFSREAENNLANVKSSYEKPKYISYGTAIGGLLGAITVIKKYPQHSLAPKGAARFFWASVATSVVGLIAAGYSDSLITKADMHYDWQQSIEREIRSGVVGRSSHNREAVLQQFTDFVNQYGVAPTSEAAAMASN